MNDIHDVREIFRKFGMVDELAFYERVVEGLPLPSEEDVDACIAGLDLDRPCTQAERARVREGLQRQHIRDALAAAVENDELKAYRHPANDPGSVLPMRLAGSTNGDTVVPQRRPQTVWLDDGQGWRVQLHADQDGTLGWDLNGAPCPGRISLFLNDSSTIESVLEEHDGFARIAASRDDDVKFALLEGADEGVVATEFLG